MRVCVFGAGAIGGYLAARLLASGVSSLSVVARGAHGAAITEQGLTLIEASRRIVMRPACVVATAQELPPQDLVFVALKANALPAVATDIAQLLAPTGTAVFINNGVPWWWNHRGEHNSAGPLPLLDTDGQLWYQVRPERAVGCIVYSANRKTAPGVIEHVANNRWIFGEPDGRSTPRLQAIELMAHRAGLIAETSPDLRREVWIKLLRNAPLNSICALTRLPVGSLVAHPDLVKLGHHVIEEIVAVAAAQGFDISDCAHEARQAPQRGGAVNSQTTRPLLPSMLQDVLLGAPTEHEAILGQPQAFARTAGIPTPRIDLLLALLRGLDASSVQAGAG